jgi:hypothetical protein
MSFLFTNNAAATLASGITSSATSLTVTTGQDLIIQYYWYNYLCVPAKCGRYNNRNC